MAPLFLKGFIRDATYTPYLNPERFEAYNITQFDVNQAHGLIDLGISGNNLAFSKWVSPKRTRSYPFARIYNTFHFNTKSVTTHILESLEENTKGVFGISNYLGGQYYLTADEVYWENAQLVIQESKNSSKGKLPSEDDIKDGFFKLILFANMKEVTIDERTNIQFTTRLKLKGNLIGSLFLPCATENVFNFCSENRLTQTHQKRLISLNQEASENNKLQIWITGRHA